MVESRPYKPRVMVLGTLGTGKSTTMNCLSAAEEAAFIAKRSQKGVTQELSEIEFDEFILIDTPGLNDPKMSTADWSTRYNSSSATSNSAQIALILLVFKCSQRPSRDDANNINVLQQVVNEIKASSCAVIFTFAD